MQTQIGKRYGKMSVDINGKCVKGNLCVLKSSEKISGEIDKDGNCHIYGKIVSLMQTIYFDGWGTITPQKILLSIVSKKSKYVLYGEPESNTANDSSLADNNKSKSFIKGRGNYYENL